MRTFTFKTVFIRYLSHSRLFFPYSFKMRFRNWKLSSLCSIFLHYRLNFTYIIVNLILVIHMPDLNNTSLTADLPFSELKYAIIY